MARQVHSTRPVTQMFTEDFPVPITLIHDEVRFGASILVHRRVDMAHQDGLHCQCEPHRFTRDEISAMTVDDLNKLLDTEIH